MAETVDVWPIENTTYPDYFGVTITAAGARVPMRETTDAERDAAKYITDAIYRGFLLTWDPAGVYNPDDRTDGEPPPVDGSTGGAVDENTVITVDIGLGVEVAYANLEFKPPYATSSTINLLTGAYSLVRDGGWPVQAPQPPVIIVIQPPAFPTTGIGWGAIYEIDFTAQANQTIGAAGSYTIDGNTWWAKGAKNANHTGTAIVNGSGLRFTVTGPLGYQPGGDMPGGGFSTQVYFFPLSQLASFNPLAPTAVWVRFSENTAWPAGGLKAVCVGLIGAASDSAAFLSASRGSQMWCGFAETATSMAAFAGSGNYAAPSVSVYTGTDLADHAFGIVRSTRRGGQALHGQYAGAFPGIMDNLDITSLLATSDPTNLGVAISLNSQSSWTVQLTHLSIMQPSVQP